MHLQQTKAGSRTTGGPQYYFHSVPAHVKEFLRKRGACPVVLQTPYGIASSSFTAVGRDHKLSAKGKVVKGNVGHDRIQGHESIDEKPERNVSAAIRLTNGSVYAGLAHGLARAKAEAAHKRTSESDFIKLFKEAADGFLTNKGRFVSRSEAYRIAVKSRQLTWASYSDAHRDLWGFRPAKGCGLTALPFNNARTDERRR